MTILFNHTIVAARDKHQWADPRRKLRQQYNTNHGGRGVYFCDPSGHYLEAITRPYGSEVAA